MQGAQAGAVLLPGAPGADPQLPRQRDRAGRAHTAGVPLVLGSGHPRAAQGPRPSSAVLLSCLPERSPQQGGDRPSLPRGSGEGRTRVQVKGLSPPSRQAAGEPR